eukprot:4386104-Amphidinium_carterae.1
MPCWYGPAHFRQARAIHAAIFATRAAKIANGSDFVLLGDFNTKLGESDLEIYKSGTMSASDDACPPDIRGLTLRKWCNSTGRGELRSAYEDAMGEEAEFTNFAWLEKCNEAFQETLDYIFVSPNMKVMSVLPLMSRIEATTNFPGGFPSSAAGEASDHVLLAADVQWGS